MHSLLMILCHAWDDKGKVQQHDVYFNIVMVPSYSMVLYQGISGKSCKNNCSGQGICNHALGQCRCFHGFTG